MRIQLEFMEDKMSFFKDLKADFTQAMNELCRYADMHGIDSRLPVSVRFILDDFATNCTITDFP